MMQEARLFLPAGISSNKKGYSILEILVVLALFVVLMVVVTQTLGTSVKSVKKSEAITKVRGDVGYAIAVIERHLHNARGVVCTSDSKSVSYLDPSEVAAGFSCQTNYIASASARLTSNGIVVTDCSFVCQPAVGRTPPSVRVSVTAHEALATGAERAEVSTSTTIYLRTY